MMGIVDLKSCRDHSRSRSPRRFSTVEGRGVATPVLLTLQLGDIPASQGGLTFSTVDVPELETENLASVRKGSPGLRKLVENYVLPCAGLTGYKVSGQVTGEQGELPGASNRGLFFVKKELENSESPEPEFVVKFVGCGYAQTDLLNHLAFSLDLKEAKMLHVLQDPRVVWPSHAVHLRYPVYVEPPKMTHGRTEPILVPLSPRQPRKTPNSEDFLATNSGRQLPSFTDHGDYLVYVMRKAPGVCLPTNSPDEVKYPKVLKEKLLTEVSAWEAQLTRETGLVHCDFSYGPKVKNCGNCFWNEKSSTPTKFTLLDSASFKFDQKRLEKDAITWNAWRSVLLAAGFHEAGF